MSKEVSLNHRVLLMCVLTFAVMILSLGIGNGWVTSANDDGKLLRPTLTGNASSASLVSRGRVAVSWRVRESSGHVDALAGIRKQGGLSLH